MTDNRKELEIFRSRIETAPEELMQRTLEAMEQREKENAEKAAARLAKKAVRKNFAFRAAVIAAVITLMILIIPTSRGYVVSAAERVWDFVGELINPLYYTNGEGSGSYYLENGKGTATVTTQELHADTLDLSDFDYESYPKTVDCRIKSDNLTISLGEIAIGPSDYYYDFWIRECSLKYSMKDKHLQYGYTMDEGLEYDMPEYCHCQLSGTSNVEIVFLRGDTSLFKVIFLFTGNTANIAEKNNQLVYNLDLMPWEIIWTDKTVEKRFITDETDDPISIKEMVQQLKPDKLEIASVSINIDEYTDLKAVASEDKMKQLEKKGYVCIDGVDNCYIMCKFNAKIIKCYNPNYYNIKKEKRNNKRIVEEYNEAVEKLKEAE